MKEILFNITSKEKRCAVLHHGELYDLIIERKKNQPLSGNIYLGRVINILHNIQSAFIDIGEGENGFIHVSDVVENTQKLQEYSGIEFDWDHDLNQPIDVESDDIAKFMEVGHSVLVQVVKEPRGSKGARLTSNIAIPGRYLVLLPNTSHRGVSRKILNGKERERIKQTISSLEIPEHMGLVCRTVGAQASFAELLREGKKLVEVWKQIVEEFHQYSTPTCLYRESSFVKKGLLMAINRKCDRVLVDHFKTFRYCQRLYKQYKDEHPLKIEYYRDNLPMFERFAVDSEIDRCMNRKVWLKSGAYLFFEKTEAMHTIDVNSGRSYVANMKPNMKHNVEETFVRVNMEAAEEIPRQLRLRNIGGLITCDFIDMRLRCNQKRVLTKLKEAMKEDGVKCTILKMNEFCLVEMTRQRVGDSLAHLSLTHCPYCRGRGMIKTPESVSVDIERAIMRSLQCDRHHSLKLTIHPELFDYLSQEGDKAFLENLVRKRRGKLIFATDDALHINAYELSPISS